MHSYIRTYVRTHIHSYIHTNIHIFNPFISVQYRHTISSYPLSISYGSCIKTVPNAILVHSTIPVAVWSKV